MRLIDYEPDHRGTFIRLFTDANTMVHVGGAISAQAAGALFDAIAQGERPRVLAGWAVLVDGRCVGHAALLRFDARAFEDAEDVLAWDGAPELGVVLGPEAWGVGVGTAVTRELISRGRGRDPRGVVATVDPGNPRSRSMLLRAGMEERPSLRDVEGLTRFFVASERAPTGAFG